MDGTEKTGMDRENPYAATPPLRGHTNVPWTPDMCNVIGRQIKWVVYRKDAECGFKRFRGSAAGHAAAPWAHPQGCGGTHMAHHEYSVKASDSTAHAMWKGAFRCPGLSSL